MFNREESDREIKEYHARLETSSLEALETELMETNTTIEGHKENFESLESKDTTGMTKDEKSHLLIDKAHACLDVIESLLHKISLECYIKRKSEC